MKKRLLFISLALVLVLTVLAPAPVLAKGPHPTTPNKPTSFEGSGYLMAIPTWEKFSSRPIKNGYILRYKGELVPGILMNCPDWSALEMATLYSVHDSIVRVDEFGNVISGRMRGTFSLTTADGESILKGQFSGTITAGQLNPQDGSIFWVQDKGKWTSTKGTGVFKGVKAWGTWSVELPPITRPDFNLLWDGKYISHPRGNP